MNPIERVERKIVAEKGELGEFRVGDTIRVHYITKEGDKDKVQVFEGILIRMKRGLSRTTITVRKISHGVGVERIFPLYSPLLKKIEVKQRGKVRRAKLYYLRKLSGKAARVKRRRY